MKELQAILRALPPQETRPSVLATLVTVEGSSYRRPGARMLLPPEGGRVGTVSGGCLEEDLVARARLVRETGVAEAVVYDTTTENDLVWGVGLGCHGVVRVLLERLSGRPAWAAALAENFAARRATELVVCHRADDPASLGTRLAAGAADGAGLYRQVVAPPTALAIFGAGDDARPLAELAKSLGWHVTIADPRAALVTPERFPAADALVTAPAADLAARVWGEAAMGDGDGLAVVMTHHYVHDVPLLRALLPRRLAFLGLLGPRKRAERMLEDLGRDGLDITPEMRVRLHAPVGLDLGADAPEQVALAIVAEMQAVLAHRSARPLRERTRPIHA